MMLLHAGRATGKTTQAMAWVSHGESKRGWECTRLEHLHYRQLVTEEEREVCKAVSVRLSYPGWSRVLVVCHQSEFDRLRKEWRNRLEDFDHRVYPLGEWLNAAHVDPSTEVCIDNLDMVIHGGWRHFPGWISAVTITAEPWEHIEFKDGVSSLSDA